MLVFSLCWGGWNSAKSTNALLPGKLWNAEIPDACSSLLLAMEVKEISIAVTIPSNLSTALGLKKGIYGFQVCWHGAYRTIYRVDTVLCLANLPFKSSVPFAQEKRTVFLVPLYDFFFHSLLSRREVKYLLWLYLISSSIYSSLFWLYNRTCVQHSFCSVWKFLRVDSVQGCQVSNNANGKPRLVMLKASWVVPSLV